MDLFINERIGKSMAIPITDMAYWHRIAKVVIEGDPNTRFVYKICNNQAYPPRHPFESNLQRFLIQVSEKTASNKYNYYYQSPWLSPWPPCYGYGRCNGKIRYQDCTACLRIAAQQLIKDCPRGIGAQLQLVDCRIRYEIYPFMEA